MIRLKQLALILLALGSLSSHGHAQSGITPKEKIPAEMLLQLNALDLNFANLVSKECGPDQCIHRGCVYLKHEVVTLKSGSSLPGLSMGQDNAMEDSSPQYFLSQARCEYAYEPSLESDAVKKLDERFTAKLSKGILRVSIKSFALPERPKSTMLTDAKVVEEGIVAKFLNEYLAHLIFIALALILFLVIVWSLRRLGKDSMEDELRMLQLKKDIEDSTKEQKVEINQAEELQKRVVALQDYFKENQSKLKTIVKKWLENLEFGKISYASHLFARTGIEMLPSESHFLQKKILLQKYIAEEFDFQNGHMSETVKELEEISSYVDCLFDERAERIATFFTNCHPKGLSQIMGAVHPDVAAALLILAPYQIQKETLTYSSTALKFLLTKRLLSNPHVSESELRLVEQTMIATEEGRQPPKEAPANQFEFGTPMEVVETLSLLMGSISAESRKEIWEDAISKNGGRIPAWVGGVFYNDMLQNLNEHQLKSLFLECDAKKLAAWYAQQLPENIKSKLKSILPESYMKTMASPVFQEMSKEEEQVQLGKALFKLCKKGEIRFAEVY